MFVNVGPPGATSPPATTHYPTGTNPVEFLFLVNGQDDNKNGWVDEGWDGVDNDGDGLVRRRRHANDLGSEWEPEAWLGLRAEHHGVATCPTRSSAGRCRSPNAREIALPDARWSIDATTLGLASTRSGRGCPSTQTYIPGIVDIMVNPDGTVLPTTIYSSPSSFGMDQAFYHFWLAERQDVAAVQTTTANGTPYLPLPRPAVLPADRQPGGSSRAVPGAQGQAISVLTLFARTGQISVNAEPAVLLRSVARLTNQPDASAYTTPVYPFIQAEQGVSGGP